MTTIKTLSDINIDKLLEVYNESYKDYVSPFKISITELQAKIKFDKIDLEFSFGIYDKGKLIGFILHSLNRVQKTAYNAGTGLVLENRNNGHLTNAYKLAKLVLSINGIRYLVHEVRTINEIAIKAYIKNGFKINRELAIFQGEISLHFANNQFGIFKSQDKMKINDFQKHFEYSPSWLNALEQIDFENVDIYIAKTQEKIVGFVLYKSQSKRLIQIFVLKDYRRLKIGTALLQHLRNINSRLSVFNAHFNEETKHFFEYNGLELKFTQYEMSQELLFE